MERIFSEMLTEVREEAEKFGRVTDIKANGGHAYVEFQEASDCQRAVNGLTGTSYEDRTLMAMFYPICLWSQNILLLRNKNFGQMRSVKMYFCVSNGLFSIVFDKLKL